MKYMEYDNIVLQIIWRRTRLDAPAKDLVAEDARDCCGTNLEAVTLNYPI
jgi:hypothetical protein